MPPRHFNLSDVIIPIVTLKTAGMLVVGFHIGNYATEHFDGIDGVIFGCARKTSRNFFGDDGKSVRIAGLLAMDASPRSFVMQLARHTQGRFSHCFVPDFAKSTSYLRFGSNAVDNPNYRRTQIIRTPYNLYYVKLNDISVNGQHLNFARGTFDLKANGEGGCIFDSGSTVTAISPAAYKVVEAAFINYFTGYGLKPTSKGGKRSQLCYKTRGRFKQFPSMTLHFQGADLQLESFNVFYHGSDNEFCLLIMPIADTTIIGVAMQMDLRVVYDLNNWVISFGRERCAYRA
ncbi:Aspartic proteinase nepenthesin-2 [Rhynchospora pubera]|uniref:Aspartic proteinase nepenthesin-2 n=1 Tax=Rhynchospora pubera TaxID=906938 RepID=A0AAV8E6F2_9POAL|nr:Aspartic proteinase nepenthesin-2 [Rhynchospora pubera]